ncbi:MAG: RdgB/HAM1 family non-canonical purine NTP pyrophosphatase [Chitinophagaceae bacterium]|nr:RdgB/HAM1 family non-canonical purine NTP pyrophosphatase [Chitinophagaceae bacterium]
MRLIFATNNQHKVQEIRSVVPHPISIITMQEAGINLEIDEPHNTLEENAAEKARIIFRLTNSNCFSEDTGLEVASLNGAPGVHSARYAGNEKSFEKNIQKLLQQLKPHGNRNARFRTVIFLIFKNAEYIFEGFCDGKIIETPIGTGGFGYDSVFVPENAIRTFAEMDMKEKNKYSHRRKAVDKLVTFLNNFIYGE